MLLNRLIHHRFNKEKKESLDKGLEKSKESFFGKLGRAVAGKSTVDADVLDELGMLLEQGEDEFAIDCHIVQLHHERRLKLICNEMLMVAR